MRLRTLLAIPLLLALFNFCKQEKEVENKADRLVLNTIFYRSLEGDQINFLEHSSGNNNKTELIFLFNNSMGIISYDTASPSRIDQIVQSKKKIALHHNDIDSINFQFKGRITRFSAYKDSLKILNFIHDTNSYFLGQASDSYFKATFWTLIGQQYYPVRNGDDTAVFTFDIYKN